MQTLPESHEIDLESATNFEGTNEDGGEDENRVSTKEEDDSVSECSVEIVDLESGLIIQNDEIATKVCLNKSEIVRDCRICQDSSNNQECGVPIELGCSCKADLAAAHTQCAKTWFKIKGNRTCEICGSIAGNVAIVETGVIEEHWDELNDAATRAVTSGGPLSESRNFWRGHRFLNFLLACMVFAFVISWLFHFNVSTS